jgi:o-succinylbenzoate synthase
MMFEGVSGSCLHVFEGTMAQPFTSALGQISERAGLVLEVWDQAGQRGVGEAAPLDGHSMESLADCAAVLDRIAEQIGSFDEQGWPLISTLDLAPAARFAWETALCDLVARRRGISVAALLGDAPRSAIPRSAVVDSIATAQQALARGMSTLKVKVGVREAAAELDFLRSLRSACGNDFALRLDANGSFTPDEARDRLASYRELRPQYVEQPTSRKELAKLGACDVPWAADESLLSADSDDIETLLAAPGCVAWVIKPAALGLRRARELALRAQARGLGVVITHLLDGPIGLAAACELALSLPQPPWACGLDAHPGLAAWPAVELPHHRDCEAEIRGSGLPGLGFTWQGLPWS